MEMMVASIHELLLKLEVEELILVLVVEDEALVMNP